MRVLVLLLLLGVGCARHRPLDDPLLVVGPAPVQPAVQALIEASGRPGLFVDGQGVSTADILAVRRGAVDLAFTSRDLLPEEDTDSTRAFLLAREGIAFAVHPSNPVLSVPQEKLDAVLAGGIRDWSALGGPAGPLRLVLAGDRVKELLRPAPSERPLAPPEAAALLATDPGALVLFPSGAVPAGARLLQPDGVPLEERTLLSGRYPSTRSYFVVVRADAAPEAQAFLAFCLGPEGQAAVARQGLVKVD